MQGDVTKVPEVLKVPEVRSWELAKGDLLHINILYRILEIIIDRW